ncbi:uncharacterized protein EAF01_010309 [Botrytis porri]|uniref:uncharacterized protein n=1 Tax=Botrytis porri TaxID=87229 RepID=UPI0019026FA6|nr:uncharacterized protein EAF01_010309 [Botrytis porri]KAF7892229.1 hypothetical protein EAF01_010309 [Botrytis porri]
MKCDDIYTRQGRQTSNSLGKIGVIDSGGFNEAAGCTPTFSKGMLVSRGTCTSDKCTYRLVDLLELKTRKEKLLIEMIWGTPHSVLVQDSPSLTNWEIRTRHGSTRTSREQKWAMGMSQCLWPCDATEGMML